MLVTLFENGIGFEAKLKAINVRSVNAAYLSVRGVPLSPKISYLIKWKSGGIWSFEVLPDAEDVCVDPDAEAIMVYFVTSIQIQAESDKKRKHRMDYESVLHWETFKSKILSLFDTNSNNHDVVDPSTHLPPVILSSYIPTMLSVVETRSSYSSLTLDKVNPRVCAPLPDAAKQVLCIENIKNDTISTSYLLESVEAYKARRKTDPNWKRWLSAALQMLQALHCHYELNTEPKGAPRRTIVDILVLCTLSTLPDEWRRRYAIEKALYSSNSIPPTTVGWGCFDYYLGNLIIRDAEEEEEEDESETCEDVTTGKVQII